MVPCGKCPSCLANLRQEWVFRLKQEYFDSVFAIFVTLTYSDENLPKDLSVNKKDIQDFHKRLRKHFPPGDLRFYLVSEYGDHTFRPHYHGLYFFKHDYDRRFIYETFEKSWNKGFLKFGNVEEGSIVYCTKYCLKHSTTPTGCTPTFRLVSKMAGGLGHGYLERMSSWHIDTEQFGFVAADGLTCRMPKYFRDKLTLVRKCSETDSQKYERESEIMNKRSKEFSQGFKEFLNGKHFESLQTAEMAYNVYLQETFKNQDDLVVKHCKKQKM